MEQLENIKLSFKCPKQLNQLQPCNGDWYCDGCHKIVHDFRGMSEGQVLDAFAKSNYQMCGMFEVDRIEVLPQQNKWFRWASAAMLFLGITGLHQRIYAQIKPNKIDTIKEKGFPLGKMIAPGSAPNHDTLDTNAVFGGMGYDPEFPGGEKALSQYFAKHLKYIEEFQGKVYVQFAVEKDGSLTDIKILRGGNKDAEEQVIKAIKAMPKWKPGIQNGKVALVQYTLPVSFSIRF